MRSSAVSPVALESLMFAVRSSLIGLSVCCGVAAACAAEAPTRKEVLAATGKAVAFYGNRVASHGGFVWKYSSDLQHRQAEGLANPDIIWVQPPGTPAVGLAFMRVYKSTGDKSALAAARRAANALVQGQLHSGGWYYLIHFNPRERLKFHYRKPPSKGKPRVRLDPDSPGGWFEWRKRRYKGNMSMMDDDVTQTALQLLMQVDKALDFQDAEIHEAAEYGLKAMMRAQFPIGAWSHNFDHLGRSRPSVKYYPIKNATFPENWSRKWTKKFSGCYELNDEITLDGIKTMLEAYRVYGKRQYLDSALNGGDFLLRAQLPEPQPAWAQQYDRHMQPVWERSFEPPAITGYESQSAIDTLLLLYERTGQRRFLDAVPRALAYLKRSRLDDGKLARFYELKTNKPLYFNRKYQLTYNRDDLPTHYGFVMESRLDELTARYRGLKQRGPGYAAPQPGAGDLARQVSRVIGAQDRRGAWTAPGWVRNARGRKVVPRDGIIESATFIKNIELLCRYLDATKSQRR